MKNQVKLFIALLVIFGIYLATQQSMVNIALSALDENFVKFLVVVLVIVVTVQTGAVFWLSSQKTTVTTISTVENESEHRGRGRPRQPCDLASCGLIPCPLQPVMEVNPEFIKKISVAVADLQHQTLTETKTQTPPTQAPQSPIPQQERHPPEPKNESDEIRKPSENDLGTLMANVLAKGQEKEKK